MKNPLNSFYLIDYNASIIRSVNKTKLGLSPTGPRHLGPKSLNLRILVLVF